MKSNVKGTKMLIDALMVFNMGKGTLLEWHVDYCQMVKGDGTEERTVDGFSSFGEISRFMASHVPESVTVLFAEPEEE